jgi:hypothetical protein
MSKAARLIGAEVGAYVRVVVCQVDTRSAMMAYSLRTLRKAGDIAVPRRVLETHCAEAERCRWLRVSSADHDSGLRGGDELLVDVQEVPVLLAARRPYLCILDNSLCVRTVSVDRSNGDVIVEPVTPSAAVADLFQRIRAPQAAGRLRILGRVLTHQQHYL